jgi:hypothetical protein
MTIYKISGLLFLMLISSCTRHKTGSASLHEGSSPSILYRVSPIYPDTVYFSVNSFFESATTVKGAVNGFHDSVETDHELYFQRFVSKAGRFRTIHAAGTGIYISRVPGSEQSTCKNIHNTIQFDESGYFNSPPGDPVDLIPLYPGHPVKKGEIWSPEASIKTQIGSGTARYQFVIDSTGRDSSNNLLAYISVRVDAILLPVPALAGGLASVTGTGWLIWDCTINQRRETHLKATYLARVGENEVKQMISLNDRLVKHNGRLNF